MSSSTALRLFRGTGPFEFTGTVLERALDELAAAIAADGKVSIVIAVANGGTIPGAGLAARLAVPLAHVHAKHNRTDAIHTQATGDVAVAFPDGFPDALSGRVLLVDDICGSGATFTALTTALEPRLTPGAHIKTVALCRNEGADRAPDWAAYTVDDWVVFPWETPPAGIELVALPSPAPLKGRIL
ncbi:phosphoribosyltransferase [Streptomyces erythrochromogenes]|uniref:phosphoribosyltransferase n=1 Tax=Streptomyces erythrochromogenes TaxID=285574 RepID=UPI000300D874